MPVPPLIRRDIDLARFYCSFCINIANIVVLIAIKTVLPKKDVNSVKVNQYPISKVLWDVF